MIPVSLFLATQVATIAFLLIMYMISRDQGIDILIRSVRRAIRNNYTVLIFYFIIFFVISSVFAVLSYTFFSYIGPDKTAFDKWEKSLQIAVSAAGFISLITSIKIWQDSDKRQVNQATLSLFEKLRDDRFKRVRDEAWEVRKRWSNTVYREKLINISFVKVAEPFDSSSMTPEEVIGLKKDIQAVRDLFEFYTNLIFYKDSPEALISCRYFYYGWWRPFLYIIAKIHDDKYIFNPTLSSLHFDHQQYINNVSYVNKLRQLDHIFGFENVPEDTIFHDLG